MQKHLKTAPYAAKPLAGRLDSEGSRTTGGLGASRLRSLPPKGEPCGSRRSFVSMASNQDSKRTMIFSWLSRSAAASCAASQGPSEVSHMAAS